jgi:hypothetical protein
LAAAFPEYQNSYAAQKNNVKTSSEKASTSTNVNATGGSDDGKVSTTLTLVI